MEVSVKLRSILFGLHSWLIACVLVAAATMLVSCGGGGEVSTVVVLLPDSLTISAFPNAIDPSEETEITVTVRDKNEQLMLGVVVEFTISINSSGGSFDGSDTAQVQTGADGKAVVLYTAGLFGGGFDQITATAGSKSTSIQVQVNALAGSQPNSISIESTFDSIPADGQSTTALRATVTNDDGSEAIGALVKFTIRSGGGTIQPSEGTTGSDGTVTVTLQSEIGSPGATVRAEVASSPFVYDQIEIEFTLGSLQITAAQNPLLASGTDSTTVTARIFDVAGNPMGAGETINFSLSDESLGTLTPATGQTNGNGEVAVQFAAGANGGTVSVKATWESSSGDIFGTTDITIQSSPAFIKIGANSPDPSNITVRGTGGAATSLLSFIVQDSSGSPVTGGYRIKFELTNGPGGGESVIPTFDITGDDGQVSTIVYSGTKSGPVTVKASYYSAADNVTISTTSTPIVISSGPPVGQEFGMFAEFLNISGLWMAPLKDVITISAGDIYGNPVPDGYAFSFKTYNMGGLISTENVLSSSGFAPTTLSSTTKPTPMQGFTFITAETNGSNSTHITSLAVTDGLNGLSTIYAGTDGGGVYKSLDSGGSWLNISRSSQNSKFGENIIDPYIKGNSAISIDPDDPNTVYVGTGYLGYGRIFRSLDGGANWNSNNVEEVFGLFESASAAVLTVVVDGDGDSDPNNGEYVWIGTEGQGAWYSEDGENFQQPTTGELTANEVVRDIVKSPNSGNGAAADLYAATPIGVYCSINGGLFWSQATNFTGDNINSIAVLDFGINDILYVGTEDAGVWVGMNQGNCVFNWTPAPGDGLGSGVNATIVQPDIKNAGNGTMSTVGVSSNTLSEFWTLTAIDSDTFSVNGTISGTLAANATVGASYENVSTGISFSIYDGSVAFQENDVFTFSTTRDPGLSILDVLVDPANNQVYASTYFASDQVEYPAGNVYSHGINPSTGLFDGQGWDFANQNLPTYDDVSYLFPQFAIAANNPLNPTQLYIGGSGINFYKTSSDTSGIATMAAGNPDWKSSKSGLTNTIMARMPILFTDQASLKIDDEITPGLGEFIVYIEDYLGNPPIVDSTFTVTQTYHQAVVVGTSISCLAREEVWADIEYGDAYTHWGTWRDPNDDETNNPYIFDLPYLTTCGPDDDEVTFEFIPNCLGTAPGCSGQEQAFTYILEP